MHPQDNIDNPQWIPVADVTLHRDYSRRYRVNSTHLYLMQQATGWSLCVLHANVAVGEPHHTVRWQQEWCERHGLLTLAWPTRRDLLKDLRQCHATDPLYMFVPHQTVKTKQLSRGRHQVIGTDVYLTYQTAYQEHGLRTCWVMGREGCQRRFVVYRLTLTTSKLVARCNNCRCVSCRHPSR
jgi:hypothetical protein